METKITGLRLIHFLRAVPMAMEITGDQHSAEPPITNATRLDQLKEDILRHACTWLVLALAA